MKRILKNIIFFGLLFLVVFPADAKVIDKYVTTDIVAYIDGIPIDSYNINGWTGIVSEDLRAYGFDVHWDAEERKLYVDRYESGKKTVDVNKMKDYALSKKKSSIGQYAGDIYQTDIKTYVCSQEVTAFNIGGRTIIYIDDLYRLGNVMWDEKEREISYNYVAPWNIDLYKTNYSAPIDKSINSFSLEMEKNENKEFVTKGENLDYLDYLKLGYTKKGGLCFSFSIYQRVLFKTEELHNLLFSVVTKRYDGETILQNADLINKHLKLSVNGEMLKCREVTQGKGNGHSDYYFWFDKDLKKDDIKTLMISFS